MKNLDSSLTDVTNLSNLQMNLKQQTCSCSTCTCSNDENNIKSNFFENTDDCLTYTFITLYECSLWCIQIIYELFFKTLWQILVYIKQEIQYTQSVNKGIDSWDMSSINNSSSNNYSLVSKKRKYTNLSKRYIPCHYSLFNQNMNRILSQEKTSSIIDKHIVLIPVRSSYCQTEIFTNDLPTININLNQSEKNINLHQQLSNTIYRRLDEPLIFTNREIYCKYNQASYFSTTPLGQQPSNVNSKQSLFNKSTFR
ncbi:unnamed protein product [Adineta steineri]|uniref:Uncharacterized protein n=1 Tax=Adineta steineri TaxID=433720 RepID=A0A818Q528_9BILA|nr:unnamed protein product [Adineta steineri]